MKYFSYKDLLINALQKYIDSIYEVLLQYINSSYINLQILDELYALEILIITQENISQTYFEILISNYPFLLDFIPKEIRVKINEISSSK